MEQTKNLFGKCEKLEEMIEFVITKLNNQNYDKFGQGEIADARCELKKIYVREFCVNKCGHIKKCLLTYRIHEQIRNGKQYK